MSGTGADEQEQFDRANESLWRTAEAGAVAALRRLLAANHCRRYLDWADPEGRTALQRASAYARIEACELLLAAGANAVHRDTSGLPASYYAVERFARADEVERAGHLFALYGADWSANPPERHRLRVYPDLAAGGPSVTAVLDGFERWAGSIYFPHRVVSSCWKVEAAAGGEPYNFSGHLWLQPSERDTLLAYLALAPAQVRGVLRTSLLPHPPVA